MNLFGPPTPAQPPPGDPHAIRVGANALAARAGMLEEEARQVHVLANGLHGRGVWSSPAALAFELVAGDLTAAMRDAAVRHDEAARVLAIYADALQHAQEQAGSARATVDRAEDDLRTLATKPSLDAAEDVVAEVHRALASGEAATESVRLAAARAAFELEHLAEGLPWKSHNGSTPVGHGRLPGRPPPGVGPHSMRRPSVEEICQRLREEFGVSPVLEPDGRIRLETIAIPSLGARKSGKDLSPLLLALLAALLAYTGSAAGSGNDIRDALREHLGPGLLSIAKRLSDEAQRAKQALEDALGGSHAQGGIKRWQQIWNGLPDAVKRELRGKVKRPSSKTGRGRGF
jgi:hypothetical protein